MTAVTGRPEGPRGDLGSAVVGLVPWDPDSEEHRERLQQQRVACGWKYHDVEGWRGLQREGKMALQWVVLAEGEPGNECKVAQHVAQYPAEASALSDSARSLGGKPRARPCSARSFVPVGHISLDSYHPDPSLANPADGTYHISTFYVSRALQGGGIGRAAMDLVETMAADPPLCAKVLALNTLANDQNISAEEFWRRQNVPPPEFSNQDWYARRGYEVYKYKHNAYSESVPTGETWNLAAVHMRKVIA